MSQGTKDIIKHVIISILVGMAVAALQALAQGIITALQHIPTWYTGGGTGVITYLTRALDGNKLG